MKKLPPLLMVLIFVCSLPSCHLVRMARYGKPDVKQHEKFPSRSLQANNSGSFQFHTPHNNGLTPETEFIIQKYNRIIESRGIGEYPLAASQVPFETFLETRETLAFLVIKSDTIHYEQYFDDYARESLFPSYSVAKSFTSLLIGCALEDGLIQSIDEPVTNYVPELEKRGFDKVSIRNVLQMTSGIDFNEKYSNPFSDVARLYYDRNLRITVGKFKLKSNPGEKFAYNSGESQLLGLILERALKYKTITEYMQEKIWSPLGMEYDATWSLDREKNGMEKTFCCFNSSARDYARIGRLYLNKGNWNGQQIISEQWVIESTKEDTSHGSSDYYQYQWWTNADSFKGVGIRGQMLYVNPSKELIVVRLGKDTGNVRWDLISDAIALYFE